MVGLHGLKGWLAAGAVALAATLAPPQAQAVIGAADNTPGATLLIPYFEVDLANSTGRNTLVSLTNTSATAMLANVVIWSDQGIPAASFNLYLTGYDMQSLSVRDLLGGLLPRTASDGQDPQDTISPQGNLSQDVNFASCSGILPYSASAVANFSGPIPNPPTPADLRAMLTGAASTVAYPGQCVGTTRGDNVARGYITIDTINSCTGQVPGGPQYLSTVITFQNTLAADYFLLNDAANVEFGAPAVAVEAAESGVPTGTYTFYASRTGFDASDRREVLPTTWQTAVENKGSELVVWRDPKVASLPHACGGATTYGALPIGDTRGTGGFGTFATPFTITGNTAIAPNVSQRLAVAATPLTGLPTTKLGWLSLSFNHGVPAAGGRPVADPAAAQSYVLLLRQPEGSPVYNLAVPATPMDTGRGARHSHPSFPLR